MHIRTHMYIHAHIYTHVICIFYDYFELITDEHY